MTDHNAEKDAVVIAPLQVGDRVRVPPSNWRPSTTGTVVEASEFCASGPVYVKRDDSGFTVGYRRTVLRALPRALPTCRHGEPEADCASCAACAACDGSCDVCPYAATRPGGARHERGH